MPKLLQRLMGVCVTVAVALPAAPVAASEGNASLFSAEQSVSGIKTSVSRASLFTAEVDPFGSISNPMDMPRPRPLLYTDAEPVAIEGGPEEIYPPTPGPSYSSADLECLAEALYFEARGEGRDGQTAVAEVILNRVESKNFPSSVCDVVNQPSQFSYTIGGRKTIRNKSTYRRGLAVAEEVLDGSPRGLTNGATYFHSTSVRPNWSHRFFQTARIGRHIFYSPKQRIASN